MKEWGRDQVVHLKRGQAKGREKWQKGTSYGVGLRKMEKRGQAIRIKRGQAIYSKEAR